VKNLAPTRRTRHSPCPDPGTVRLRAESPPVARSGTPAPRIRLGFASGPRCPPRPTTPTVSSVRPRLGRHRTTTRCAASFFEQQMRNFPIDMLRRFQSRFGHGRREMGPTKKRSGFLRFPTHKQSVTATVNHQVGGSSPSREAINSLPAWIL
jgi:hypothetical protein